MVLGVGAKAHRREGELVRGKFEIRNSKFENERTGSVDEKRAIEITEAVLSYAFYDMGLKQRPLDVGQYSLEEMIQAKRVVTMLNETSKNHLMVVPDDRMIAAVYTLTRFQPEACDRPVRPVSRGMGRALLCVTTEDVT